MDCRREPLLLGLHAPGHAAASSALPARRDRGARARAYPLRSALGDRAVDRRRARGAAGRGAQPGTGRRAGDRARHGERWTLGAASRRRAPRQRSPRRGATRRVVRFRARPLPRSRRHAQRAARACRLAGYPRAPRRAGHSPQTAGAAAATLARHHAAPRRAGGQPAPDAGWRAFRGELAGHRGRRRPTRGRRTRTPSSRASTPGS